MSMAKLIFVLIIFFLSYPAQALEVVQIEPVKIRLSISPGNSRTGTIQAYNLSRDAKKVKVYLEDWYYLPACDGTKEFRAAGTTGLSAAKWITFVPADFNLAPYGKQTINYSIKVPPDAKGGHYAVMFFENYLNEKQQNEDGVSVDVAVRVASLFYIEPEGTINRSVKVDNLSITRQKDKLGISATFANEGNVDVTARGTFFIIDEKGMVFARGEFNEVYTLPGDSTTIESNWSGPLSKGKYDLVITLDLAKSLEEIGFKKKIPAVTKEAEIEVGEAGELLNIGPLR